MSSNKLPKYGVIETFDGFEFIEDDVAIWIKQPELRSQVIKHLEANYPAPTFRATVIKLLEDIGAI